MRQEAAHEVQEQRPVLHLGLSRQLGNPGKVIYLFI